MTKILESVPEPGSFLQSQEPPACRKLYETPALVEWGSIVELTAGGVADVGDEGFNGSGGV